ncbi:MAG: S8 family serine peptidase [Ardenticatenaceae bacterium]|nr:S8 family serine peptidase [Ardenticatenaceae bacterium]
MGCRIVVVTAAGNSGPDPLTIAAPGNDPYVITVGSFTDNYTVDDASDDYLTPFSGAGPTETGFVKPDVVAPGAHARSGYKWFPLGTRSSEPANLWQLLQHRRYLFLYSGNQWRDCLDAATK